MKFSIIATAGLALLSSGAAGVKVQKRAKSVQDCIPTKEYIPESNTVIDLPAKENFTVPRMYKKGNPSMPIECCIWKHADGDCEAGKDDKLVKCATAGQKIDLKKHLKSAASLEFRCNDPGLAKAERKKERMGLKFASCPAAGDCSWFNSGDCEKHCGQRFFSKMESCGWGKKRCCCHAEIDRTTVVTIVEPKNIFLNA
jgi:hypothetical protein